MIHVSATHRIVGVPLRSDLANLFPAARRVTFEGKPTLLLPHGFTETKILRNLGMEIPAPVLTQYKFPGHLKPFDVQLKTVAMLTTNQRAYVLNDMGTGKTKALLWAFDYLKQQGLAHKLLIVAPLSTLDHVWRKEIFETTPHLSCTVLHGTRDKRIKRLAEDRDIYIINLDGIDLFVRHDGRNKLHLTEHLREDIDCLGIDELALFRNGQTDRNKAMRLIARNMPWAWGMTGAPTPNLPTDVWGQAKILTPHTIPEFFGRFRDELMLKVSQFKYAAKADAVDKAFKVLQPAVRYELDDVTELPDVIQRTIDIDMGKKQEAIYETLRKEAFAQVGRHEITAVNAGAVLNKLLQVSLGYVYARERKVVTLDNKQRLEMLINCIPDAPRKALIFVPYTHALDGICDALTSEGIDFGRVDGGTSKADRDQIFTAFQSSTKYHVIAAHPGTMSHGLTLTAADTIIWFGPTTSLETFEQANARVRRVGQKRKQQVLMFQGSPAEKKIYARLRQKKRVQDILLELFADAS